MIRSRRKRICLVVLLAALAALVSWARWRPAQRFQATRLDPHQLRLVTWNVGYFTVAEDKNVRASDLSGIASTIRETAAEVAVLQELGSVNHAVTIAEDLGDDWTAYSVGTGLGNQVIAVLTKLEARDCEELECGGRKILGLSLKDDRGAECYIVGVHAPHPVRGRVDTVASIRGALAAAKERTEAVRIVAGDMNYDFDPDGSDELYLEVLEEFGDGTISLGETYYAHTRIDHCFHYPKALPVLSSASGMVEISFRFAKVPGFRDHRPIVVTYDLSDLAAVGGSCP